MQAPKLGTAKFVIEISQKQQYQNDSCACNLCAGRRAAAPQQLNAPVRLIPRMPARAA